VTRLAVEFRLRFKQDVVIDMYCYRKYGHNEGDEPRFTQPLMYALIDKNPGVREVYARHLVDAGHITRQEADGIAQERRATLEKALEEARQGDFQHMPEAMGGVWALYRGGPDASVPEVPTAVPRERLLQAIDQLRTTASAMKRAFLVEVMGRHCGYLALMAGIAGGAEVIALPEVEMEPETVAEELLASYQRGKSHAIAVVAEGAKYDAQALMRYFEEHHERLGFDLRVTKLGHIQRGGTPGAFDRMLGTLLGAAAVDAAFEQRYGTLIGMRDGKTACTPLKQIAGLTRPADLGLLELARVLAM